MKINKNCAESPVIIENCRGAGVLDLAIFAARETADAQVGRLLAVLQTSRC